MMSYVENAYRIKKIGEKNLITTDHGSWAALNEDDVKILKEGGIEKDPRLFSLLEERGIIITDKNREGVVNKLGSKYSFLTRGTSLHIVIPTLRCNEKCLYCHASSKPEGAAEFDMDEDTARSTVDFIFQSPSDCIMVEFQGGEPLLNFKIVKFIVDYAKKLNTKYRKKLLFSIVSNFGAMDKDKMEFLIGNQVGICTSLDGPEWLHNKNRPMRTGGKSSYYHTKKWIELISGEYEKRKIKNKRVNALITITKFSLNHWKEIIDEYVKLGINDIFLRFLNNLGDARGTWKSISYDAEEFIDFWKKSVDYMIGLNREGTYIREWFTWIILQKIVENKEPNFLEQISPCGAVIGQMAYNYNGGIYSCDEGRMIGDDIFKIGDVKKDKYKDVVGSNQSCCLISSSINDVQICDFCAFKPYCGICPVCNYAERGSIVANIAQSNRCKIYMSQFDYIFGKVLNDAEAKRVFLKWLKKK